MTAADQADHLHACERTFCEIEPVSRQGIKFEDIHAGIVVGKLTLPASDCRLDQPSDLARCHHKEHRHTSGELDGALYGAARSRVFGADEGI
jgi:hypothetical protein